jgi:hypothetical protein
VIINDRFLKTQEKIIFIIIITIILISCSPVFSFIVAKASVTAEVALETRSAFAFCVEDTNEFI